MKAATTRHYEIDTLRVIALVLLILYHIFICYQNFGDDLSFIRYSRSLEKYWPIGELINIWRIPVLFVISGMAVGFVMRRRTSKEVIVDRLIRLVPPLVFTSLVVFPIFPIIYSIYKGEPIRYIPMAGHLWFVQNLVIYSLLLWPVIFWFKKQPENFLVRIVRRSLPLGLIILFPLPLMVASL
ncbi:MAG: acyltransferase family protein, partial [Verrucomicrobiota bacterium]